MGAEQTEENVPEDSVYCKFGAFKSHPAPPDAVVISGFSGIFPISNNIAELSKNLYEKSQMMTSIAKRWKDGWDHPELPKECGLMPRMQEFDPGHFGIHYRLADESDSLCRMALEVAFEAILDAGLNPADLENSRTAVLFATCFGDSENWIVHQKDRFYSFQGIFRTCLSAKIAYYLKLKGPVSQIDTACSSSLYCLDDAFTLIRSGECDSCLVMSGNLVIRRDTTLQFGRLGVLSKDSKCKTFDITANGYARSEAVNCVLLQKAKDAKRVYAQVVNTKTNCDGYKEQGITFPSAQDQACLLKEVYKEAKVDPESLSYIEAHGTGTKVGDPEECISIDINFCQKRKTPLLIGSTKSNLGHSEPASGINSLIKVLIALESNLIPPNANFSVPNPDIPSIIEGRLKVVTEPTKMPGNDAAIVGVSSFGFGGANAHVILRRTSKKKANKGIPDDELPRLVFVSGRTEDAINCLLNTAGKQPLDADYVRLIQNIFRKYIPNHLYRGYSAISKQGEVLRSMAPVTSLKVSPLSLIFGEIHNWESILNEFCLVPAVSETLQTIDRILCAQRLTLKDTVLNHKNEIRKMFDVLGSLIAGICLANLLKELELSKANILGCSHGELISAYYEGVLNLEEVLKCALILNTELSTIPTEQMNGNAGTPHSPVKSSRKQNLAKKLLTVVNTPRPWKNGSMKTKIASAEYFADEVLSKNKKISDAIKSNSILLEIGTTGLNQTTENLEDVKIVSFQNFTEFLNSLGSLYLLGHLSSIDKLYPKIEFPVKRGTPMISSDIKWKRDKKWWIYDESLLGTSTNRNKDFTVVTNLNVYEYVTGHVIDGRNLFPASGYLVLVWDTLNTSRNFKQGSATVFESVRFLRATTLANNVPVDLTVRINKTGIFEVLEGNSLVVTGIVYETVAETEETAAETEEEPVEMPQFTSNDMDQKDIYKDLRLRGYDYRDKFRSMVKAAPDGKSASIKFDENYVTFIDNMFQLKILAKDSRQLYVPTNLDYLRIDKHKHSNYHKNFQTDNISHFLATYDEATDTIRSGGIEVRGIYTNPIQRKKNLRIPVLEKYEFIPNNCQLSHADSIRVNTQILLENTLLQKIKSVELVDSETPDNPKVLSEMVVEAFGDQPLIQANAKVISNQQVDTSLSVETGNTLADETDCILVIGSKLTKRPEVLLEASNAIKNNGYILSRENRDFDPKTFTNSELTIVTVHPNPKETLILLKKLEKSKPPTYIEIQEDPEFSWLSRVQSEVAKPNNEVVLYSQNNDTSGLLGFTNCLKREPGCQQISCVLLLDAVQKFDPQSECFAHQLKKHLTVNVYKNGQWGTFRHMLINDNKEENHDHAFAKVGVRGDLSSFAWHEGPLKSATVNNEGDQNICDIYYSSLNFRDVMTATGKISTDSSTIDRITDIVEGFEFSGKDINGRRVMGLVPNGALANKVMANDLLLFPIPDSWSLKDASTVVCVYTTIIYAFQSVGKMKAGETVLIHSGTGGVGQAAIQYALHYGCTVFTTCGSKEKREFLKKKFPQLTDRHIGNSRDTSFVRMVKRGTNGKGVNIVLNSLAEEKLLESVKCLARGGRFLEIGKFDFSNNNPLNLMLLEKEASFHGIFLDMFFKTSSNQQQHLQEIFQKAVADGAVKPLEATTFKPEEIEQAFRYMASGKHMGKVVIEVQPEDGPKRPLQSTPRYYCNPVKSYVILGGLGGFGLELADWLIVRGAKYLVLTSRSGIRNGYQKKRILLWRSYGVVVQISTDDVTTREGCQRLIENSNKLAPVGGIFNLAVVLQDSIFENQTVEMYKTSLAPKAYATKHLDEISRKSCPELDDFVIFSSVSCGRGNAGQTNYGMANSVMERICERRKKDGLPAVAIQWGAIGEVGLVAQMQDDSKELEIGGTLQQRLSSCLEVMDVFLKQKSSAVVSSIVVAEKKNAGSNENVSAMIANILGLDLKSVQGSCTLAEMGMDSMSAIEIKQIFEREYGIFLTAKDIRTLTFNRITEIEDEKNNTDDILTEYDGESENLLIGQALSFVTSTAETDEVILDVESGVSRDQVAPTVLLLPGIEGSTRILKPLAKKLKAHVVGIHYDFKNPTETISDMAKSTIDYVEKNFKKNQLVYIVAHSLGTCISLEAVSILEKKGYNSVVICLDGSPAAIKSVCDELPDNKHEFQTEVLLTCIGYSLSREVAAKCKEELIKQPTLEGQLSIAVEILLNHIPGISGDLLMTFLRGMVYRMGAVRFSPVPNYSLKSKILLCKAGNNETYKKGMDNDYMMEQVCGKPVEVLEFEGNHNTMIDNDKLADTINSLLM